MFKNLKYDMRILNYERDFPIYRGSFKIFGVNKRDNVLQYDMDQVISLFLCIQTVKNLSIKLHHSSKFF